MDLKFEDLFDEEILKRGYKYYKQDLIYDVTKDGKFYEGLVDGTEEYHVKIEMEEQGKIINMRCTCPYARRENCKHMAALLYYIGKEENIESKKEIEEQDFEENSKEDYEKRIARTINRAMGRTGYIAYHKTYRFLERMYVFIHEAENLIKKKEYQVSFWIATLILEKIPNLDIDDHDGNMYPMAMDCAEIIEKILQKCKNKDIENEIFDWLNGAIKNNVLREYSDVIEEVLDKLRK